MEILPSPGAKRRLAPCNAYGRVHRYCLLAPDRSRRCGTVSSIASHNYPIFWMQRSLLRAQIDAGGQRIVMLDQLAALEIPAIILWGREDLIFPVAQAKAALRRLRHGQLTVIPESGHLPHVEQPSRCADTLATFLTNAVSRNVMAISTPE